MNDVAQAVRGFFEADLQARERLATGPAKAWVRLHNRALRDIDDAEPVERTLTIRRLEVERVDGSEAHVSINAEAAIFFNVDTGGGRKRVAGDRLEVRTSLAGPLLARRVAGRWLVADYAIDGQRLSDSLGDRTRAIEQAGLRLSVAAVRLFSRVVGVYLELESHRVGPVVFTRAWRGAKIARLLWLYHPIPIGVQRELPPHKPQVLYFGWQERHRGDLRLVLRGGGREVTSPLTVQVHIRTRPQPRIEPLRRTPLQVRLESWRRTLYPIPLLVMGGLLLLDQFTAAAAVVATYALLAAAETAWGWSRRLVTPRQLLGLLWYPLALFALAALLLAISAAK